MFVGIIAILAAVALSLVSAVFSISGVMTIFSGAAVGAGIMGGVLEFAKTVATVWLYNFWKKANTLLKTYFLIAITILILISSIGIYGYLSKAYIGQGTVALQIETKMERLNQYISREQRDIDRANSQLDMLEEAFDRYLELNIITRALDARDQQEEERSKLIGIIEEAENNIAQYEDELFEYRQELNTIEVNVGPVKYLAMLMYGEDKAKEKFDDTARILILLIVAVFDPFAVLLMVAGNISLDRKMRKRKRRRKPSTPKPPVTEKKKPEEALVSDTYELREIAKDSVKEERKPSHPAHEKTFITKRGLVDNDTPPEIHKKRKIVKPGKK